MSDNQLTTTDEADPTQDDARLEERRDEAVLALDEARSRRDLTRLWEVLRCYADLRDELIEHLERESKHLRLAWPGPDLLDRLGRPKEASPLQKYELLSESARGAFGKVYKARDRVLGRLVAIKVYVRELAARAAIARFEEEPQLTSLLDHPGIVPIHERGRMPDGKPYYVMRWVEGPTLQQRLSEAATLRDRLDLLEIFKKICEAVGYAHARGVLHRDLKPANVMLDSHGVVLVVDWGLSKILFASETRTNGTAPGREPSAATQAGNRIGTPSYMAPEQARGETDLDRRCDVFGLGAILCEILTGRSPYWDEDLLVWGRRIDEGDLRAGFARLDNCGADSELIALAKRCLMPRREDRLVDANQVAQGITAYLMRWQRDRASFRSRLVAVSASSLLLVVLALSAAALVWFRAHQAEQLAARRLEQAETAVRVSRRNADVRTGLDRFDQLLRSSVPAEAARPLGEVGARIAEGDVDESLRHRFEAGQRHLAFVLGRESIRQQRVFLVDGIEFDDAGTADAYGQAFRALGFDLDDPASAARLIEQSPIRTQLLAALDHWAMIEAHPGSRRKILSLAQKASPTAWGKEFRNPNRRFDPTWLDRFAQQPLPTDCGPVEIESLAWALLRAGRDPEPLLRRGLIRAEGDFWLNLLLALALERRAPREPAARRRSLFEEAAGYARASLCQRPGSIHARERLGRLLLGCGRYEEAVDHLARVVVAEPRATTARYSLAQALLLKGDVEQADNVCREALAHDPGRKALQELHRQILARGKKP